MQGISYFTLRAGSELALPGKNISPLLDDNIIYYCIAYFHSNLIQSKSIFASFKAHFKKGDNNKKKDFKYVFFFLLYCRILNRDFGIFVHLVCAADVHSVIKSTNMTKNIMLEVLTLGC